MEKSEYDELFDAFQRMGEIYPTAIRDLVKAFNAFGNLSPETRAVLIALGKEGQAKEKRREKYFRRYNRIKNRKQTFSDMSDPADEEINLEESFDSSDSEGDIAYPTISIEDQVLINDALESLDEPLRTVFILRYKYNMQVESIDPNEPTLRNHFDKTPRPIRNWLKKADEILKKKQGENHE